MVDYILEICIWVCLLLHNKLFQNPVVESTNIYHLKIPVEWGSGHSLGARGFSQASVKVLAKDFCGGPVVKTSPPHAGGTSSIPVQGPKILHALGPKRTKQTNMKQKQHCNKFNKVFKNGPHKQQQKPKQMKKTKNKKPSPQTPKCWHELQSSEGSAGGICSQAHRYGCLWAAEGPLPSLFTRSVAELSFWRAAGLRTSGSYRLLGAGIISLPCGPLHRAV